MRREELSKLFARSRSSLLAKFAVTRRGDGASSEIVPQPGIGEELDVPLGGEVATRLEHSVSSMEEAGLADLGWQEARKTSLRDQHGQLISFSR